MSSVTATAVLTGWRDPVTFIPRPLLPMEISNSWKYWVTCYVSNNFWPVMSLGVTGVTNRGEYSLGGYVQLQFHLVDFQAVFDCNLKL